MSDDYSQNLMKQTQQRSALLREQKRKTRTHIAALVRQSYDIFDTFGKPPESLENVNLGFYLVLDGFDPDVITRAFHQYLKTKSVMPKPAQILEIINSKTEVGLTEADKRLMRARDATAKREAERYKKNRAESSMSEDEFNEWYAEQKRLMVGVPENNEPDERSKDDE